MKRRLRVRTGWRHRTRAADKMETKKMKKKGGRVRADKKIKGLKNVERAQAHEAYLEACRARREERTRRKVDKTKAARAE